MPGRCHRYPTTCADTWGYLVCMLFQSTMSPLPNIAPEWVVPSLFFRSFSALSQAFTPSTVQLVESHTASRPYGHLISQLTAFRLHTAVACHLVQPISAHLCRLLQSINQTRRYGNGTMTSFGSEGSSRSANSQRSRGSFRVFGIKRRTLKMKVVYVSLYPYLCIDVRARGCCCFLKKKTAVKRRSTDPNLGLTNTDQADCPRLTRKQPLGPDRWLTLPLKVAGPVYREGREHELAFSSCSRVCSCMLGRICTSTLYARLLATTMSRSSRSSSCFSPSLLLLRIWSTLSGPACSNKCRRWERR